MDISGTQACELPLPPSFTLGCCAFSTVSPSRAPLFPGDRAADLQAKAKEGKLRWGGDIELWISHQLDRDPSWKPVEKPGMENPGLQTEE